MSLPNLLLDEAARVVAAHLMASEISTAAVRREIVHAAARASAGFLGASTASLVKQLEQSTGCSIAELAEAAETWPSTGASRSP